MASRRADSSPVFSNAASILTVPPRPGSISAVAVPNVTWKPANQASLAMSTVAIDGSVAASTLG